MDMEFENLSYQDFYEDKILLIEYDLSPDELQYNNKILIQNQSYTYTYPYYTLFNKKELHKIYRILIGFILPEQLGSVLCLPLSRNWSSNSIIIIRNKEALQHGIDISNFHNITDNDLNKFRKYEVKYTHNVLLHWEEITDKSYLNFIIDSTIISLNKLINQRALGYKNYVINKEDVRIEFRINPINQIK